MSHHPFSVEGQVALITGSSRGIGLSIAEHFARAGAKVVISSRKLEACEQVRDRLKAEGLEAIAVACNVGKREDLETLVARTLEEWGRIDVLVANAAVNPHFGPLASISDDAWSKILHSNLTATLWLANRVLPHMAERGSGSVIILSSVSAFLGSAQLGAYAISKAAEAQLARNLAVEWGRKGIRANAIAPGVIATEFARALWEDPKARHFIERSNCLGRIGQPDDVGGLAVFLASQAAGFITGQTIIVDGGGTVSTMLL
jgi:dehydrogenase/reductase SDR family member 4